MSSNTPITPTEERTLLAEERTLLAEERTLSAWVRTGLASIATGMAIAKLLPQGDVRFPYLVLGFLFVVVGGASFLIGFLGFRHANRRWPTSSPHGAAQWLILGIGVLLLLATVLALTLLSGWPLGNVPNEPVSLTDQFAGGRILLNGGSY